MIEEPVEEKYQVSALLASLPRSCDTVVSNLCTNDSATFSFIQESLLNEEMRRRSRNELQSGGQPKSLGGAVLVGAHKSKPKKPPTCFGCRKVGHFKRDCSKQKGKNESGQNANHMREVSLEDAGGNGFVVSTDALQIPGYALTLREEIYVSVKNGL